VSTPLSRWIVENIHWHGVHGWRWVFILEGVPSLICGVAAFYWLTDRVADARWLPDDEKIWLAAELKKEENAIAARGRMGVMDAFRHPKTALMAAVLFLIITGNQAILFFLPSITNNMKGLSITWSTVVAVLPYIFSIGGILINGYWSSRTGELRWHTSLPILITACALACAIVSGDRLAFSITFFCLLGITFQAYLPVFWTFPARYLTRSAAAAAIGAINSIGNLGGFVGPYIFGYLKTATGRYDTGLWFLTGCMVASGLLATQLKTNNEKNA
jgi:ACS family tartrate transporter-like MFS transporter